jgi:hypothetical protein
MRKHLVCNDQLDAIVDVAVLLHLAHPRLLNRLKCLTPSHVVRVDDALHHEFRRSAYNVTAATQLHRAYHILAEGAVGMHLSCTHALAALAAVHTLRMHERAACLRAAIVAAGQGPEALLPSSVPDGELDALPGHLHKFHAKVHADGRRHVIKSVRGLCRLGSGAGHACETAPQQGGRAWLRQHICRLLLCGHTAIVTNVDCRV